MYFILILALILILPFTNFLNYHRLRFLPILVVSVFLMFNRGNNDYQGYQQIFIWPEGYSEPGYSLLIKIIKLLGGTSHDHVLLVLGIFWFITFYRYSKYTKMFNFVLLLYVIFPFVLDITQIRNTFMMLFVLNALLDFFNNKKNRAFLLLIIGSTFHSFGIFFVVLFLLLLFKKGKSYYKWIAAFSIISVFLMPFIIQFAITVIPYQRIVDRIIIYTADTVKVNSLIIWGGILVADLIVLSYFIRRIDSTTAKNMKLIYLLFDVMFTSMIFLASVLYLYEFNRLFRMLFLVKYFLAVFMLPNMKRQSQFLLLLYLIATTSLFAFLYSYGVEGIDYNYVLIRNAIFGY